MICAYLVKSNYFQLFILDSVLKYFPFFVEPLQLIYVS